MAWSSTLYIFVTCPIKVYHPFGFMAAVYDVAPTVRGLWWLVDWSWSSSDEVIREVTGPVWQRRWWIFPRLCSCHFYSFHTHTPTNHYNFLCSPSSESKNQFKDFNSSLFSRLMTSVAICTALVVHAILFLLAVNIWNIHFQIKEITYMIYFQF